MVALSLTNIIEEESCASSFPAAVAMVEHIRREYGASIRTILFYGSCLRLGTDRDLILDFYVLVDSLKDAISNPTSTVFGKLLPPNVYYQECDFENRTVRAKVCVMTLGAFVRGTAESCFSSAIWGRFSQPVAIVYASDGIAQRTTEQALARAVKTIVTATLPLMTGPFTPRSLWATAYRATYSAELRPEPTTKADELVNADIKRYELIGMAAMLELGIDPHSARIQKPSAIWIWALRRWWGRLLNILRLIKAAFTFKGGLEYAVWKIERHYRHQPTLIGSFIAGPVLSAVKIMIRVKASRRP